MGETKLAKEFETCPECGDYRKIHTLNGERPCSLCNVVEAPQGEVRELHNDVVQLLMLVCSLVEAGQIAHPTITVDRLRRSLRRAEAAMLSRQQPSEPRDRIDAALARLHASEQWQKFSDARRTVIAIARHLVDHPRSKTAIKDLRTAFEAFDRENVDPFPEQSAPSEPRKSSRLLAHKTSERCSISGPHKAADCGEQVKPPARSGANPITDQERDEARDEA